MNVRLTLSQRLRLKLRALMPYRQAAEVARATGIPPQYLTYFAGKNPSTNRHPIKLDDLEKLADYFRCSVSELIGETHVADLTGDEQRIVYAFRALSPEMQEHLLAVTESAAGYKAPLTQKKRA